MSDVIKLLPDSVANQIAAGEVIQRPASVIKELVENAIDAQATHIQIILKDAGRTLIQIIDDGVGMSETDARLAFERHSTSKIRTADDLFTLHTMGFRGEALASIAAISQVELRTRRHDEQLGTRLLINASQCEGQEPDMCPVGSNFMIKNLFFNVPARRKFLKSNQVELSNIVKEFEKLALINSEVEFTFIHNGTIMYKLLKGSFRQRIAALMGNSLDQQLLPVNIDTTLVKVQGYVGKPENARKRNALQFLFVNGRFMRHPYFHKAVMTAYDQLIPEGEQPNYFLRFSVDPQAIDVNIHPTKTEIKFEEDSVVFQTLYACVREAMGRVSAGGAIDFDNPEAREMPVIGPRFEEYRPSSIPTVGVDPTYNPFAEGDKFLDERDFALQTPAYRPSAVVDRHEDYGRLFEDRTMPTAQVLTVQGKYIFSQSASGVMITHIRRARERILYDRFLKVLGRQAHVSQSTLFPVQVNVGVEGRLLFDAHADLLKRLGFDIDAFGTDTVVVNGVPEGYSTEAGKVHTMVGDLILILADDHEALPEMMEQSMAQKFAVLGAAGGEKLVSPVEAQRLLDALLASENPEYTSSGRRIISILPLDEIEKRF